MKDNRLSGGQPALLRRGWLHGASFAMAVLLAGSTLLSGVLPVRAAEFPFERVLVLDVAPMSPIKRVPVLTVADDGSATIDLWCRTATARVQVSDSGIRIDVAPLSEDLPQYMSSGQCTPDRVRADNDLMDALAQVTDWRGRPDGIELIGAKRMRFRLSSH